MTREEFDSLAAQVAAIEVQAAKDQLAEATRIRTEADSARNAIFPKTALRPVEISALKLKIRMELAYEDLIPSQVPRSTQGPTVGKPVGAPGGAIASE